MFKRLMTVAVALCMTLLVQAPIVSNCPAFADSPPVLNKDTDPKVLRKYIISIDRLIKRNGKKARYLLSKGQCYEWLKEHQNAIQCYSAALAIDPANANAYLGLARNYRVLKKFDKAVSNYSLSIKNGQTLAEVYAGRALAYVGLQKYRRAILDANKAIDLDQKDTNAWYAKGVSELNLGQTSKSIISFSEAIKIDPRDPDLYAIRSTAYLQKGDRKNAEKDKDLYRRYSRKF